MEVHKAGGGINFTVNHTKKATEDELYQLLMDRLARMLRAGNLSGFTAFHFSISRAFSYNNRNNDCGM